MNLFIIILVCFLGSVSSIGLAYLFFKLKKVAYANFIVSIAVGTLLGVAFLEILPHAFELSGDIHYISMIVLLGIFVFFILEKLLVWRHCHGAHCADSCPQDFKKGSLLIIGDCFHNFIDGVLISSAFIVDIRLGFLTALAIISHEIPQEISNFSILINAGYSLKKTISMNALSGISMILGAISSYIFLQEMNYLVPVFLAFAAASMIYVAISDLIPSLHEKTQLRETIQQCLSIFSGVMVIYLIHSMVH